MRCDRDGRRADGPWVWLLLPCMFRLFHQRCCRCEWPSLRASCSCWCYASELASLTLSMPLPHNPSDSYSSFAASSGGAGSLAWSTSIASTSAPFSALLACCASSTSSPGSGDSGGFSSPGGLDALDASASFLLPTGFFFLLSLEEEEPDSEPDSLPLEDDEEPEEEEDDDESADELRFFVTTGFLLALPAPASFFFFSCDDGAAPPCLPASPRGLEGALRWRDGSRLLLALRRRWREEELRLLRRFRLFSSLPFRRPGLRLRRLRCRS